MPALHAHVPTHLLYPGVVHKEQKFTQAGTSRLGPALRTQLLTSRASRSGSQVHWGCSRAGTGFQKRVPPALLGLGSFSDLLLGSLTLWCLSSSLSLLCQLCSSLLVPGPTRLLLLPPDMGCCPHPHQGPSRLCTVSRSCSMQIMTSVCLKGQRDRATCDQKPRTSGGDSSCPRVRRPA